MSELDQVGKTGTISLEGNESIFLTGVFLTTNISLGAVGIPGNILLNAQQIILDDSTVLARSEGTQNSGNIEIGATFLDLQSNSIIEVFSSSNGGDINVTATELSLSNFSQLRTQTAGIDGGNIKIDVENLTMSNNSSIFTNVRSPAGEGGNIEINADGFISAVLAENSDIFTRGDRGRSGDLRVAAQAIFGFNIGENLTGESDILGNVEVVFEDVSELDDLEEFDGDFDDDGSRNPLEFRQPREEFAQQCGIAGQNELAIAGRSGMRTNSSQILRGREVWQDRRDIILTPQTTTEIEDAQSHETRNSSEVLIEARGWQINERGNIELVGEQSSTHYYQCTINNK